MVVLMINILGLIFSHRKFICALMMSALIFLDLPATVQAQYTYTTNSQDATTITITGYSGPGGDLFIPSNIVGNAVTGIGLGAFSGNSSLTSVTIPNSITSIGQSAFWECSSLTNATIPESVTNIGRVVFYKCTRLLAIMVDTNNTVYSSSNGVLFNKDQTTLIQYPGGKTGDNFSYAVPESVSAIGDFAFNWCIYLSNIIIGNGVTYIGSYAFYNSSINRVTIPDTVTSINDSTFFSCDNLTSVWIGAGVTNIGAWAFYYCPYLSSVIIPPSVTSIGSYAFNANGLLIYVYFKGNAPVVASDAFGYPTTIYYSPSTKGWPPVPDPWAGRPTALWQWRAVVQEDGSLGVQAGQFGFNIISPSGMTVVVEANTNLITTNWVPVVTNALTNGELHFGDPQWTNYPGRFYRLRSQ